MNPIIETLNTIKQERDTIQVEYDTALALVHEQFRQRISQIQRRYDAYELVAKEQGLLNSEGELRHPAQKYEMPIGDAVQLIFEEKQQPMTIEQMQNEVIQLGITPPPSSIRSVLAKDKRFFKISRGYYRLRTPQDADVIETEEIKEGEKKEKPVNGFVMIEAIRELIAEKNGEEFTDEWVFNRLNQQYPESVPLERYRSVQATLGNLVKQEELDKTQRGEFGNPARYKIKDKNEIESNKETGATFDLFSINK